MFSTANDNQHTVSIKVFQGEEELMKDNTLLGTFNLSGIPLAACGVPRIEVLFEVDRDGDRDGIMRIAAKDKQRLVYMAVDM